MRHKVYGRHLGRTSSHRVALKRNLAASLFEHGAISTTREKAKFVKPFAEKLITLAKEGSLQARRRAISLLRDRDICKIEDGEPVKVTTVIQKLFSEIGPLFADRTGGYTRIINLPLRRLGDNGQLVLLQLVKEKKAAVERLVKPAEVESDEPQTVEESPAEEPVEEAESSQTEETAEDKDSEEETKE
jgi:large subunit ribosomal protein L17